MTALQSTGTGWAGFWGPNAIINANGTPLGSYTPTIVETADGTTGGSTPTFYSNWTRTTTVAAPSTDALGNLSFWTDPGLYLMTYTLPGASPTTFVIEVLPFYPDAGWNVPASADVAGTVTPLSGDVRMANAATGAITETIPAPSRGARIKIVKTDTTANPVYVQAADSSAILQPLLGGGWSSSSEITIVGGGNAVELFADNSNWHVTGFTARRVGIVDMFAGSTVPAGSFLCNGQAISRTVYADLFAVIGTTWGVGDGSTTFNVPDMRSVSPIGAGTGTHVGTTGRSVATFYGGETHQIAATELPQHTHSASSYQFMIGSIGTSTIYSNNGANVDHSPSYNITAQPNTGNNAAATTATPTVGPSLAINFIIWAQ
jgi:microcystin-dependent protein